MRWRSASGPLLCYVTDRRTIGLGDPEAITQLLEIMARAARAGVDAIQVREKDLSGRAQLDLVGRAATNTSNTGLPANVRFLINDRLDVALAAGAAGVHLGGQSVPVEEVARFRAKGGAPANFLIGRSCHSLDESVAAERDGADYLFFGPVFATPSKAAYGPAQGLEKLATVCRTVGVPVLAIGGVTLESAAACLEAGAAGVAAIRLFQEAADLDLVVERLKRQ
jgi:thiamine-phosphate pyrophosphorylase